MADVLIKGSKQAPRVDLTPMVDLGFLLITFFMFSTTMSKPKAFELQMPYPFDGSTFVPQNTKASVAMTIIVEPDHKLRYYFGETILDPHDPKISTTTFKVENGIRNVILQKKKEIKSLISQGILEADDQLTVLIKPTDNSSFDDLVSLLDEMNINNVKLYTISDPNEVEKQVAIK